MRQAKLFWVAASILAACVGSPLETRDSAPSAHFAEGKSDKLEPAHLTLLHTNDIHMSFIPEPALWREDKPLIGGFEMLDVVVRNLRAEHPDALLLDAGDVSTGNPIGQVEVDGLKGWPVFELMEGMGYDAWTPGNHDFDLGPDNLLGIVARLKFPTVCSNLARAGNRPVSKQFLPSTILRAGKVKVGVIGLMTPDLFSVINQRNLGGIRVRDPRGALEEQVALLDPQTDVLVLLSHMGDELDREIARAVPELDVIIGGHSHKRLYPPEKIGDTLVVQAGSNLKYLGHLELDVARDKVVGYWGELIPLWVDPKAEASGPIKEAVARAQDALKADFGLVVGRLEQPWTRAYHAESNEGNWVADRIRESTGADVAFINSGGLRKDLPAGPVTRGDIYSVLPFENNLCTFEISGEELERIVQHNANAAASQSHGILQVSGLSYTWHRAGERAEVTRIRVKDAPVRKGKRYVVGTNDYLASQHGAKYFGLDKIEPTCAGPNQRLAILESLKTQPRISTGIGGRIVEAAE